MSNLISLIEDEEFNKELLIAVGSGVEEDWGFDGEDEFPYERFDADFAKRSVLDLLKSKVESQDSFARNINYLLHRYNLCRGYGYSLDRLKEDFNNVFDEELARLSGDDKQDLLIS